MHGRKPDADFGTGFRLPVAPPKTLEINRQENGRFPEALRLMEFGPMPMIAGPSHAMWAESQLMLVGVQR